MQDMTLCSFKIRLQNLRYRQICIQDRSSFPKICPITSLQNLRYQQICTQDRSSFPKIYPILRLQKPPVVPSNLHASIQPLCNVIPFWRFRASSKPEVPADLDACIIICTCSSSLQVESIILFLKLSPLF